jgi:predicted Zn-dependent protease
MTGRYLTAVFLLALSGGLAAEPVDVEPKIPPGYTPEKGGDEQGLWMEVDDYEKAVKLSALLVDDADLNNYVRKAACRVAGDYCGDLRIYVIRNPGFNASMTPNGMMQVWTGLLLRVSSEDELAAVLGHELAHYVRLHTLDRLRRIKVSLAAGSLVDFGLIVLAGVPIPIGQMAAVADAMSFSREQEEEADLLGARFMADSDYDPHASYRVWNMLVDEETMASAKREKPGPFNKTHPDSDKRAETLARYVSEHYGAVLSNDAGRERHVEMLNRHYMMLMEDQIDTNRFGRTRSILDKHKQIGVEPGLVDFFYGEMYRQRGQKGDKERAKNAYSSAIQRGNPPPVAFRNLGYLNLKEGDTEQAKRNFNQYLQLSPDATDREMIEFYMEDS